jgi:hypothetical protein
MFRVHLVLDVKLFSKIIQHAVSNRGPNLADKTFAGLIVVFSLFFVDGERFL